MPDFSALSLTGAKVEAIAGKARLANSVLHLFQDTVVASPTTTLAILLANEADYAGYAPLTIATWSDPILAGVAYAIFAPNQVFRWATAPGDVGNQIGGAFLVLSTGELYQYTNFDPTRPIMGPDQAITITPIDVYPAG